MKSRENYLTDAMTQEDAPLDLLSGDFEKLYNKSFGLSEIESLDEQLDNDEKFNKWLIERNKEEKSRTNVGDFYVRGDDDEGVG